VRPGKPRRWIGTAAADDRGPHRRRAASEWFGARVGVRFVIPVAMVLSAAGLLALARPTASSGYGIVALAMVIFGSGLGLGLPLAAGRRTRDAGTAPGRHGHRPVPCRAVQSVGVALGTTILLPGKAAREPEAR
jgi:hypothetical protein